MMISSFRIADFKSFVAADVHLAPMTFLVGPNASGKSNALEALRLLNWLARGMRPEDIGRTIHGGEHPVRGHVSDLFRNTAQTLSLCCRLEEDESKGYELELAFRLLDIAIADLGGFGAGGADNHDIGNVHGHCLVNNATGRPSVRVGTHAALGHIGALDQHAIMLAQDLEDLADFAGVLARDDHDLVALANTCICHLETPITI